MKTQRINQVEVPSFVYGTAWKEEDTARCVTDALEAGFRGIDTANQRKHYFEAAVGDAVKAWIESGAGQRTDLFLQSKFTHQAGQDHRLPYDPKGSLTKQVEQSFASSLEHLHTDYLDSLVLHGPSQRFGLADGDWEAWRSMEAIADSGAARLLGVSNVGIDQLEELWAGARVKPAFVQNRCFARSGLDWDREIRAFCTANGVAYQGFSLLTANRHELAQPAMKEMAQRLERTIPQLVFRFALQVGMQPLTGTTSPAHMREDLEVWDFELSAGDVATIEKIGG
jgi:diketogulonate reductase-like aldo/keto reductase